MPDEKLIALVHELVRAGWHRGTVDHIDFADSARDLANQRINAAKKNLMDYLELEYRPVVHVTTEDYGEGDYEDITDTLFPENKKTWNHFDACYHAGTDPDGSKGS